MTAQESSRGLSGPAGVTCAACILTLILAAPVLVAPSSRLFGNEIVGRHHDPYTVIVQLEGSAPPGIYAQPATDYPGRLLAALLGDGVAAYNLLVLVTFPLTALFTFLLARHLGARLPGAWVAAFLYAFAPFHLAHAAYHPHIAQTQWLPLYLLVLWRSLERPSVGRLALLVSTAAVLALSNFYGALLAAVVTPCALAAWWLWAPRDPGRGRNLVVSSAALLASAGVGAAYLAGRAPAVLSRPGSLAFPREDLFHYSARWFSYLLPSVEHPLLGGWASAIWAQGRLADGVVEQQLTLGWAPLALAAAALWHWTRSRQRDWAVPALAAIALVCFLFSLGPEWRLGSWTLPRPTAALYALLPMFRAHARFGLMVILAVAILAGLGTDRLLGAGGRRRRLAALLLVVAAVELAPVPPWRWRHVLPTAAHRWLQEQPPAIRALDCVPASDPIHARLPRLLGRPLGLLRPNEDCAAPDFPGRLAAEDFDHVLVRRTGPLGAWLSDRDPPEGLRQVERFDDSLVFAVEAPPAPLTVLVGPGFHWREFKGEQTYRWMSAEGQLWLENRTGEGLWATLELELTAFGDPRRIELALANRPVGGLVVGPDLVAHAVGPLWLASGRQVLRLRSSEPPTVADDLLDNGDTRPLSIALWDWGLRAASE